MEAQPTQQDIDNAETRRAIAERGNAEFTHCCDLALRALGPGHKPWMKIVLLPKDHRKTGNRTPLGVAWKVYFGEKKLSEMSVFLRELPDGTVKHAKKYEDLFGGILLEESEVCWGALDWYEPRSATELAALRVSREQGKARREAEKWVRDNPLLRWGGIGPEDE